MFAAAVSSHADRPFLAIPANAQARLPARRPRDHLRRGRARVAELSEAYARAGYGLGPSRGDAAGEPPRARAAQAGAATALGVCCVPINPDYRAGETAYLLEHSKPDLVLTLAAREGQVREALAQSAHKPPVALSERVPAASAESVAASGRHGADARDAGQHPLHLRHHRAAEGLHPLAWLRGLGGCLVCRARRPGDAAPGPGAHLQSAAALSRQRRRRVADGRHRHRQLPDPARPLPSAACGGARSPRRGPPSCTTSASSRRCCWASRAARTTAGMACASASAPASSRSCMRPSRSASASR